MTQKKRGAAKRSPRAKRPENPGSTSYSSPKPRKASAAKAAQPQSQLMTYLLIAAGVLVVLAGVLVYTTVTGRTGTKTPAAAAQEASSSAPATSTASAPARGDKGFELVKKKCLNGECHDLSQFPLGKSTEEWTTGVDLMIEQKKVTLTPAEKSMVIAYLAMR